MSSRAAAAALILGLLAAACDPGGGGGASSTSSRAPASTGRSTLAHSGEALATYSRSGGLAGRAFRVVVRPDGTFEGGSGKQGRGQLGGSAVEELRRLVTAFSAARPEPSYGRVVPDGFVTAVEAGGASTSVLTEAAPPPAVQQLVGFLAALERQLPR